jgi:hypothetical protein
MSSLLALSPTAKHTHIHAIKRHSSFYVQDESRETSQFHKSHWTFVLFFESTVHFYNDMPYTFHTWENSYLYFRSSLNHHHHIVILRMSSISINYPTSALLCIVFHLHVLTNLSLLYTIAKCSPSECASSSLSLNHSTPTIYRAPIHAFIVH